MKDNTKLSNDKEFLKFIKKEIKNGYQLELTLKEIDNIVNKFVIWYEFKYPLNYLLDDDFNKNYVDLKDKMTIEQFLLRLNSSERQIIECNYKSKNHINIPIYESKKIVDFKQVLVLKLVYNMHEENDSKKSIIIFEPETGIIIKNEPFQLLLNRINEHQIKTIEELYEYLVDKKNPNIDLIELERTIKNKKIDEKIRKYVLEYVTNNILNNNIIDNLERQKLFKKEINEYIKEQNKYINYEIYIKNKEKQLTKKKKL